MKPILFAAALTLVPAAALAQDPHAGHSDHAAHAQAEVSAEETMLRTTIAALQAGTPNYDDMVSELSDAVRAGEASIIPMIQAFGAIQTLDHQGEVQGAQHFRVAFENAETDWFIALGDDGKIAGLVFRPAG
ncbi:MAG: hypothetical protein ACK4FB_00100 [Brevundimonas sp.]|uniref:hypothetical protein n=1 Tax=Brevundimonas sp. TaxID=1871086 RepID=UPI00391BE987